MRDRRARDSGLHDVGAARLEAAQAPRVLEQATLATTAVGLALWVLASPQAFTATILGVAAVLHARRLWRWKPPRTRGRPILWVLHAAYAWLPIGLVPIALSQPGVVGISAGIHALAVGATGGLIIGMITRTARGHTGRTPRSGAASNRSSVS